MAGRISYYGGIVTQGLVLDLDAAKRDSYVGTGTAWNDISGNRNNGTLTNGPTFNSGNGGSIVFDGSNDYVNCGNILNLGFNDTTLCAWIKTTSNQNYAGIIGKPFFGSKIGRYSLHTRLNGALGLIIQPGSNIEVTSTTGLINTGNWVFVTGVINRINGVTIYINGVQVGTTDGDSSLINFNTTDTFNVGFYNSNPSGYFNGSISQTAIYNRALSATEVLQNYNATKGRYL
jgi:hypothetical protein